MPIQPGDKLPVAPIKRVDQGGFEDTDTGALFAGRDVVLFAVPGAFTPTCSERHIPGFVANYPAFRDKGILTIKGERKSESNEQTERYSRVERRYGSFHRRFALPDSADPEGISAMGRHGVLEITIPKRPETKPRRIQVGRHEGESRGNEPSTRQ